MGASNTYNLSWCTLHVQHIIIDPFRLYPLLRYLSFWYRRFGQFDNKIWIMLYDPQKVKNAKISFSIRYVRHTIHLSTSNDDIDLMMSIIVWLIQNSLRVKKMLRMIVNIWWRNIYLYCDWILMNTDWAFNFYGLPVWFFLPIFRLLNLSTFQEFNRIK